MSQTDGTPWVDWLPGPWDATIAGLSDALQRGLTPTRVNVSVLEGASVYVSARQAIPGLRFNVQAIPSPDPRTPIGRPFGLGTADRGQKLSHLVACLRDHLASEIGRIEATRR